MSIAIKSDVSATPELWDTETCAAKLSVHPSTLEKGRSTGSLDIPHVFIGRRCLYPAFAVREWIEQNLVRAE